MHAVDAATVQTTAAHAHHTHVRATQSHLAGAAACVEVMGVTVTGATYAMAGM